MLALCAEKKSEDCAKVHDLMGEAAARPVAVLPPVVLAPPPPTRGIAAPAGVGVSSAVNTVYTTATSNNFTNNTSTSNIYNPSNFGNTKSSSIVLL